MIAKLLCGKKLVYDIFDNVVIQATSIGGLSGKRPGLLVSTAARLIKRVENSVIKRADAVILVDECRRELLGAEPRRLEFIYNSPEAVAFAPACSETGLRIAYIGQLARERGILEMLDVVARRLDFRFDLAGFGADEEHIAARAAELPNVTWHGRVDYDKAIELSRKADVLFATYDPALPLHKYSSANKLFEAMMLGKPIIVARDTGMDAIVEKHGIGIVIDYADLDQIERALLSVMEMERQQRQEMAQRARAVYDKFYSSDIMRTRLIALYESISA